MASFTIIGLNDKISREFNFSVGFGRDLSVKLFGEIGKYGLTDKEIDLINFAASIYQGEKLFSRYQRTNPPKIIKIKFQSINPQNWNDVALEYLAKTLGFMGNCKWEIEITPLKEKIDINRSRSNETLNLSDTRIIKQVILFSGGMDSTCGILDKHNEKEESVLISFYNKQKTLQRSIAMKSLDYKRMVQIRIDWKGKQKGYNKSFLYRSFFFLSLASSIANTYEFDNNIKKVYHYENGMLALAIPPSPAYLMTKHSHPLLHKYFKHFLINYYGGNWEIINPFKLLTKNQAVQKCYEKFSEKQVNKLLIKTETCWYQYSNQLGNNNKNEKIKKQNNIPCGICIPCINRLTAFEHGTYQFDFSKAPKSKLKNYMNDSLIGINYRAYYDFINQIKSTIQVDDKGKTIYNTSRFYFIMPGSVRELIDYDQDLNIQDLHKLCVKFTEEFERKFTKIFSL